MVHVLPPLCDWKKNKGLERMAMVQLWIIRKKPKSNIWNCFFHMWMWLNNPQCWLLDVFSVFCWRKWKLPLKRMTRVLSFLTKGYNISLPLFLSLTWKRSLSFLPLAENLLYKETFKCAVDRGALLSLCPQIFTLGMTRSVPTIQQSSLLLNTWLRPLWLT